MTTAIAVSAVCPRCGTIGKSDKMSCCGRGGSWFDNCGGAGNAKLHHTWYEGIQACKARSQSKIVISQELNGAQQKNTESSQNNVPISKANYEEMQAFATRLENELDKKNFFYPEGKKKRMKTRLRKLIYGLELNKEDVKIFHGVLKALTKTS